MCVPSLSNFLDAFTAEHFADGQIQGALAEVGLGSFKKQKNIVEKHLTEHRRSMFDEAVEALLTNLKTEITKVRAITQCPITISHWTLRVYLRL